MKMTPTKSRFPIIDLSSDSPFSESERAAQIRHALGTVGFFSVKGSQISQRTISSMFDKSRAFFALSHDEKNQHGSDSHGRGYFPSGKQHLDRTRSKDHKESFSYGKLSADAPRTPKQPLPAFFADDSGGADSRDLAEFYSACHDLSARLMALFALALKVPESHFSRSHSFGMNTGISLIHYPMLTREKTAELQEVDLRAGAHKDWGTLTLLFQEADGPPGLEVFLPSENPSEPSNWYPAPVEAGTILVNVGLGMELWSGETYRATLHRVVFPSSTFISDAGPARDRFSIAYFVQADDDVPFYPIDPRDGTINTSQRAVTSLELFEEKLRQSLTGVVGPAVHAAF